MCHLLSVKRADDYLCWWLVVSIRKVDGVYSVGPFDTLALYQFLCPVLSTPVIKYLKSLKRLLFNELLIQL